MPRKRSTPRKVWQRRAGGSAQFAQIYHDLLDSPAFHSLSDKQKLLYVYCVRETHGDAMRDAQGQDERLFYMNAELRTRHGLYAESDTRGFERDVAALIESGFVDCLESNYRTRTKNLYRLSGRWCQWGGPEFIFPEDAPGGDECRPGVTTNYMSGKAYMEFKSTDRYLKARRAARGEA